MNRRANGCAQTLDEVCAAFPEILSLFVVMRRHGRSNARTAQGIPGGKFLYY
jgi:hypothetical protein